MNGDPMLKIIIEHGTVKREIVGPFNLCMDEYTAQIVYRALSARYESAGGCWNYGWVQISEEQPSIANTPPIAWDAPGGKPS
jgi:hypothetical protein